MPHFSPLIEINYGNKLLYFDVAAYLYVHSSSLIYFLPINCLSQHVSRCFVTWTPMSSFFDTGVSVKICSCNHSHSNVLCSLEFEMSVAVKICRYFHLINVIVLWVNSSYISSYSFCHSSRGILLHFNMNYYYGHYFYKVLRINVKPQGNDGEMNLWSESTGQNFLALIDPSFYKSFYKIAISNLLFQSCLSKLMWLKVAVHCYHFDRVVRAEQPSQS
jgi:hypothetical protein